METIYLQGSEDVLRASHNMQSAASDMQQAAMNMNAAVEQNQRQMEDWLLRFETAVNTLVTHGK